MEYSISYGCAKSKSRSLQLPDKDWTHVPIYAFSRYHKELYVGLQGKTLLSS